MAKTQRTYISTNTYKTPSGLYYSHGKRISAKMGHARESSAIRAKARYREDGKWTYLRIKVNSDIRDKSDKSRKGSPDNDNYNVSTIYDPEINEELALADAEKRLDKEDSEYTHFNLEYLGEAEE